MTNVLNISHTMNLQQLADRMGEATELEAIQMRIILIMSYYNGMTTADVPNNRWADFCTQAVKSAAWDFSA